MASKLGLYQRACVILEERVVRDLEENRPVRRRLDAVWDNGGVKRCLEEANWNFAMRDARFYRDPSVQPEYGLQYAFTKPDDWARTYMIASDGSFSPNALLRNRDDKAGYWFADVDPLYARYVSDDEEFGGDLSRWTEKFTEYVAHEFAWSVAGAQTGSTSKKESIGLDRDKACKKAKANDALEDAPKNMPTGGWARARGGGGGSRSDGGSNSNLIG